MTTLRPFGPALDRLKAVKLRPTRQRLALARLLFDKGDRHVSAEQLHGEAMRPTSAVSLATVYNTLHQFTALGMLREVVIEPGRSYFDTNVSDHHHFFYEDTGILQDIPGNLSSGWPCCRPRRTAPASGASMSSSGWLPSNSAFKAAFSGSLE